MKIFKINAADPFAKRVNSNRTTRKVLGVRGHQDACLASFQTCSRICFGFLQLSNGFLKEVQRICNVFKGFHDFPMPFGANSHLLWYIKSVSSQMGNQLCTLLTITRNPKEMKICGLGKLNPSAQEIPNAINMFYNETIMCYNEKVTSASCFVWSLGEQTNLPL